MTMHHSIYTETNYVFFIRKTSNNNIPKSFQFSWNSQVFVWETLAIIVCSVPHLRSPWDELKQLTHWGQVTHIWVTKLTIISSDNGLSPERRQAIIWTNAGILLIGPLGTNFSEILIEILTFSFTKMRFKVSSAKWRPFCLGLNGLREKWTHKFEVSGKEIQSCKGGNICLKHNISEMDTVTKCICSNHYIFLWT